MNKLILLFFIFAQFGCAIAPKAEKEVFIVDPVSPQIPISEIEIQLNRTFPLPGLRNVTVAVSYLPLEDAVCLNFSFDLFTYNQFWSRNGREVFVKALEKYNADYAYSNLDSKDRKARNKYGTVLGYLTWQTRLTRYAHGNMNVELGYVYKDNVPYFTVFQKRAAELEPSQGKNKLESQDFSMYFTPAQAQILADLFDQDFLLGI